MIMLYNKEIQDEIDAENAMEMKQSLVCIVPDCHFCPPRFYNIRPKRELALLTFMEYIDMYGLP